MTLTALVRNGFHDNNCDSTTKSVCANIHVGLLRDDVSLPAAKHMQHYLIR